MPPCRHLNHRSAQSFRVVVQTPGAEAARPGPLPPILHPLCHAGAQATHPLSLAGYMRYFRLPERLGNWRATLCGPIVEATELQSLFFARTHDDLRALR